MNKNLLAAAFCVVALCGGAQAAERLWTGGGDGFRWSDAKNWSPQGVPGAGDDIKIENTSGSTLSVSNDIVGLSVAHILPGGTSPIAFSGEGVTVTGDGNSWSNNVVTTCDFPIKFTSTNPKMKFGSSATFNADVVSTASSGIIQVEGKSYGIFNGHFLATNQNLRCYMNNGVSFFYKPIYVKDITSDGYIYGALRFYTTNNVVGTISPVLWTCEMFCENVFAPSTIWSWGTYYTENSTGRSYYQLNGHDQTIDRFGGSVRRAMSDGSLNPGCYCVKSTSMATITLRATADCTTYANLYALVSLVWDPVADYTLNMPERAHATSGTLTVKRGTMRISLCGRFASATAVTVHDGAAFDMASTNTTVRSLNAVKAITLHDNARFYATNCTAAFIADNAAVVKISSSSKFVLKDGLSQSVKKLSVDGVQVAPGTYTGQGGATGSVVPWIEGHGTIVVAEQDAGTWWTGETDSDFNTAANWTAGVPTETCPGHVTRHGENALSASTAPAAALGSLDFENESGTTAFSVTAPVALNGGAVKIGANSQVTVGEGGEWVQDFTGAASADSTDTFSIRNGGRFTVAGGFVSLTNTTGRLDIGGSALGDDGMLEISSGTCILKRTSGDFIRIMKHGTLKMTGGLLKTRNFNSIGQYGGLIDLSGNALLVSTFGGFDSPLRTITLRMSGNSEFRCTPESQSRWFFNPNASGETCLVELSENAFMNINNDNFVMCNRNGGKTIVRMRGRSRLDSANGVYLGSDNGAYGELDIGDDAFFKQEYYNYGINIGSGASSSATPVTGIVRMSGNGRLTTGRSPNTSTSLQGLMVGSGGNYSKPVAYGFVYMSGGAITNINNGVFSIGTGAAEGLVEQSGGVICHKGSRPLFVGFLGGKGVYTMTGGELHALNNNVYIGGALTNAVSYYMSGFPDKPSHGTLSVSGGEFKAAKNIFVSFGGYGTLEIGAAGLVEATQNIYFTNSVDAVGGGVAPAKIKFTLGPDGCGSVRAGGVCQIAEDAEIEIDASAYTARKGVPLLTCGSMQGRFAPEKITILAEHPSLFGLRQTDNGLRLTCASGLRMTIK